jgi:hypothetical protein
MASLYGFIKRLYLVRPFSPPARAVSNTAPQIINPPAPEAPSEFPLRFGIPGAANVAPMALIYPVINHPDAVVEAVPVRGQARADAFAKRQNIPKAYGGPGAYQSPVGNVSCRYIQMV